MENLKLYLPKVEKCPNISFQMRVLSFLICLTLGFTLSAFSIFQLTYPLAHYRTFSLWYSLSNIIWLISTFLLIGTKENYIKLLSDELYTKTVILSGSILFGFLFGLMTSSKAINLFFDLKILYKYLVFLTQEFIFISVAIACLIYFYCLNKDSFNNNKVPKEKEEAAALNKFRVIDVDIQHDDDDNNQKVNNKNKIENEEDEKEKFKKRNKKNNEEIEKFKN